MTMFYNPYRKPSKLRTFIQSPFQRKNFKWKKWRKHNHKVSLQTCIVSVSCSLCSFRLSFSFSFFLMQDFLSLLPIQSSPNSTSNRQDCKQRIWISASFSFLKMAVIWSKNFWMVFTSARGASWKEAQLSWPSSSGGDRSQRNKCCKSESIRLCLMLDKILFCW